MKLKIRKFNNYYNSIWFVLYENIKEYGLEKGYSKLLEEYNLEDKKYSGYFEMISAYLNDYDKIQMSLNPDYFKFVDVENLNELEKKTVYILAASLELRVNKPIFELIYNKIIEENKIESEYSLIIAKYILKYMVTNNRKYVIKNIISEVFGDHILYKNIDNNTLVLYTVYKKDKSKLKLIDYIKKLFFEEGESFKIYWNKHFLVFDNKCISKLDNVVAF